MLALPLVRGWDAALTYGSIRTTAEAGEGPFFVGRETLLGSLVQAISQPELRGTYLVSGYRGAGKTSLVIEAARRAKPQLSGRELLTLVLNVSEVSASLDSPDTSATPELHIDARRVITALLRSLRNEVTQPQLATAIDAAYEKAIATQFTQTLQRRSELAATQLEQRSRTFAVANLLNLVGALAVAGAAVLGAAWAGAGAAFPVAIAALAGVAVFGFSRARSSERKSVETDTSDRQSVRDNSLHQIETDLRDILSALADNGYRTMFVLEELDKLTDQSGEQLKGVIRYFKNLFTQAPALFFFLTDKKYFDDVDKMIAEARREGSYAVEHTFFTQRIFVTRPSLEECLDYFERVLPEAGEAVGLIRATQRHRVRKAVDMRKDEIFLRGLLFNAQNHLFDLKAEMRGYVQVDGADSRLQFDETALTAEEEGVAAFQFVLEQKARVYRFDGGRDYANETLRNCLSGVFADIGGEVPQPITALYPNASGPGSQISRSERRRIVAAVDSLLAELERGGAIDRQTDTFRWRDNPAANFSPVPELEPAERALEATLRRAIRIAEHFGGPADEFAREIEGIGNRTEPMVAEESDRIAADVNKALADVTLGPRDQHQSELGAAMESIGRNVFVESGRLLLVYGVEEEHRRLVASFVEYEPVAVVLVDDDPVPAPDARAAWRAALPGSLVLSVPLAAGPEAARDELDFARDWLAEIALVEPPGPAWVWLPGENERRVESPADAVAAWLASESRWLAVRSTIDEPALRAAFARAAPRLEAPRLFGGDHDERHIQLNAPGDARSVINRPTAGLDGVTTLRLSSDASEISNLADLVDGDRAWALYESAAERGDPPAMAALINRSPESAAVWTPRLLAERDWDTVRWIARNAADPQLRAELYTAAAQAGDVDSMVELAVMPGQKHFAQEWGDRLIAGQHWDALADAAGRVTDEPTALAWLERAGTAGRVNAMIQAMLRAPDVEKANHWEQRLIATGDAFAMRKAAERSGNAERRARLLEAADQVTS